MKAIALLLFVGLSSVANVTLGDSDTDARNAFRDGVKAFEAGNTDKALTLFEKAYALRPSYKILFNIAQAQAETGEISKAARTFEKYLQDGGGEISPGRRVKVEAEIQRLRSLGKKEGPKEPAPTETPDDSDSTEEMEPSRFLYSYGPIIAGGAGATTLTIGIVLAAKTVSLNKTLKADCADNQCNPDLKDDMDRLKRRAIFADIMFVTTSLLTGTAFTLLFLGKRQKRRQQ